MWLVEGKGISNKLHLVGTVCACIHTFTYNTHVVYIVRSNFCKYILYRVYYIFTLDINLQQCGCLNCLSSLNKLRIKNIVPNVLKVHLCSVVMCMKYARILVFCYVLHISSGVQQEHMTFYDR